MFQTNPYKVQEFLFEDKTSRNQISFTMFDRVVVTPV